MSYMSWSKLARVWLFAVRIESALSGLAAMALEIAAADTARSAPVPCVAVPAAALSALDSLFAHAVTTTSVNASVMAFMVATSAHGFVGPAGRRSLRGRGLRRRLRWRCRW